MAVKNITEIVYAEGKFVRALTTGELQTVCRVALDVEHDTLASAAFAEMQRREAIEDEEYENAERADQEEQGRRDQEDWDRSCPRDEPVDEQMASDDRMAGWHGPHQA